jgi:uncharacterized protein (DUF2062 family)
MFRRRKKSSRLRQLVDFFWPSIGFRRSSKYVGYRLGRLKGSPYSLAAGFACGAAVSFTPLLGLHFVLAGLFAWIMRGSILASALGTAVGNPWTFPFIWTMLYKVGRWILGVDPDQRAFPDASLTTFFDGLWSGRWEEVSHIFHDVIYPMLLASVPICVIVWLLCFYPLWGIIGRFQDRRAKAILKGQQRQLKPKVGKAKNLGVTEK